MPTLPSFDRTTAIVARGAGVPVATLLAGLRVATAADLDAIVRLRREVYGGPVRWNDERYLAWRYGLGAPRKAYATLRVLALDGRLVAAIGAEELTMRADAGAGESGGVVDTRAACAMDLLALPALHEIGIGAWLNQVLFREYPLVLALGANPNSAGLVQRLYTSLPGRQTFQLPLDAREFLKRKIGVPLLRGPANMALAALIDLRNARLVRRARTGGPKVAPLERFTEAMERSFGEARRPGTIMISRTADYLNWRFLENPRTRYRALAAHESGQLSGYTVFRVANDHAGRKSLHVMDWWTRDSADTRSLGALIGAAIAEARAQSAHYLSATALGAGYRRDLRRAGFLQRSAATKPTGFHCAAGPTPALPGWSAATETWHLNDLGDDGDG